MSPPPIWPSADFLLVNLDLTLPTRGPEPGDETPRMMPLAIDRSMSVRYSGLRLGGVTHSSRMTGRDGYRSAGPARSRSRSVLRC